MLEYFSERIRLDIERFLLDLQFMLDYWWVYVFTIIGFIAYTKWSDRT